MSNNKVVILDGHFQPFNNSNPLKVEEVNNTPTVVNIYATLIDEVSDTVTYVGKAITGTATSTSEWLISKISVSGDITTVAYASDSYDKEWDDRATYTYS